MNLRKFAQTEYFFLLILALVSFAIMLPVLLKGIPFGYDLPHHYQCVQTFVESIRNGDFYPSWSVNRNFGFGGMESRLYPPISHYSLALAYLLIGNWHLASWATFFIYTFLGGLGVYLWAKEYLPSTQAVFAGAMYILLPYHLNQLYNTFFYAEYIGSCVLPFSFYFLSRVCRRGKTSDIIGLSIAFAVLILTHLPLTVIGSICLAIYGLTLLKREEVFAQLCKLSVAVAGGIAASSFFWTKVLLERNLMAKTSIYSDPWLDYRLHFLLTPIQTFVGELRERIYETATFYYDLMLLFAVVLALCCTVPFFLLDKRSKFSMRGIWILFGASVFLILPFSRFIWDALPFLQEVQFPWRWVAVVCIFSSILAASQINFLVDWFRDTKRPFALIICGSILAVLAFSLSQIVRQAPHIEIAKTENIMQKNAEEIGFTFWWTIWTRKETFENKEKVTSANRSVQINAWTATNREFQISEGDTPEARIATFYHPNWKAEVNGGEVELKPDENGAILIPLTNKKSSVKLIFIEPTEVIIGGWVSLGVWLLLFFGISQVLKSFKSESVQIPSIDFWELLAKIYALTNCRGKVFLLFPVALLTLLPMILLGVFEGGDLLQHIHFATTFRNAIADGSYYPSWGGFENMGYGSNGVRFYPPAIPFLLGLLQFLTGDWHTASWIVFLAFTLFGALGVYFWAKEYLPSEKAIWAGIIFILMPYHLFEIHNAAMYAEFAGVSVISFAFLFLTRVCRRGWIVDILGLAVAYAILILTHLPTTVIGSFALLFYGLLILPKGKIFSTAVKLGVAVGLGICASAAYWSRMLFERDWLRNTKLLRDNHFDYKVNFLLTPPQNDESLLYFFNFIMLSLVLIVAGSVVAIYRKKRHSDRPQLFALAALFSLSILLTTPFSQPLWAILPYLHEVQFPWRWLTIASVCAPVLIALGIESLTRLAQDSEVLAKRIKAFALLTMLLFGVIYGFIWVAFQLNYVPAADYQDWAVKKSESPAAEWFWTPQMKEEAFRINEKLLSSGRETSINIWKPEERVFTVGEGAAADIRVATIYYPHWKATVNGKEQEVKLGDDGAILIPVEAEKSEVRLWFEEPARVKNALILSKITWFIFLAVSLFLGVLHFKRKEV